MPPRYLTLILLLLAGMTSQGQFYFYDINFDDTVNLSHLRIDTTGNPGNPWQIGPPSKVFFGQALSAPNAIITDTLLPYPVNCHSTFTVTNLAGQGFTTAHTAVLAGSYMVYSDSLHDYGKIEFSPDNGASWHDLLNDTTIMPYIWWDNKPVLTGRSNGWQSFYVNLAYLGFVFGIPLGEPVLYRFSFISDNTFDNLPGLMYDNLHFEDWTEGIAPVGSDSPGATAIPNPATYYIDLGPANPSVTRFNLQVTDALGHPVFSRQDVHGSVIRMQLTGFGKGIYLYRITTPNGTMSASGKFLKRE